MSEENSNRIGIGPIIIAGFIDLAQIGLNLFHAVPVVGTAIALLGAWFLTFGAWLGFYIYFKIKGVSFSTAKRILSFNGGALVESIPLLNALPAWTLAVTIVVLSTRVPVEKITNIASKT